MADNDAKRPVDPRGDFGQATTPRVSESRVAPGVAKAHPKPVHAPHPPLAAQPADPAPLAERFARKG